MNKRVEDASNSFAICAMVDSLSAVLERQVIAIVCADDHGVLVAPMPGFETDVLRSLASVDWKIAVRLAEEHQQ